MRCSATRPASIPGSRSPYKRVEALLEQVGLVDAATEGRGVFGRDAPEAGDRCGSRRSAACGGSRRAAAGLDPLGRRDVLALIESLRGATTIFYSTHILDDVQRVSDRVAVLDHGRLLAADTTENLLASSGRDRVHVVLRGAPPEAGSFLAGIAGVATVVVGESRGGSTAFTLKLAAPDALAAVRVAVTALAAAHGYGVVDVRPVVCDLEEVFCAWSATRRPVTFSPARSTQREREFDRSWPPRRVGRIRPDGGVRRVPGKGGARVGQDATLRDDGARGHLLRPVGSDDGSASAS